jgi:hypothetical protein
MTQATTNRWTHRGKDRLYVKTPDGLQVGWLDLITGKSVIEQPALSEQFHAAIREYEATWPVLAGEHRAFAPHEQAKAVPVVSVVPMELPVPVVAPAEAQRPVYDLALNRPGQAVRALAETELAAMKDRSKIGTFFARVTDAKTEERAWRVGAEGEESVGPRLEELQPHGWFVLHSVPVGKKGSDIDHVLIGPGGVYTINTKNHPGGKIWVGQYAVKANGQSTDYLRNSRYEAQRTEKLLSKAVGWPVPVRSVLVILTGTRTPNITFKQRPDDVIVLSRIDVPESFKRAPQTLSTMQVAEVFGWARLSTTWV